MQRWWCSNNSRSIAPCTSRIVRPRALHTRPTAGQKVWMAMSGGVDSSVAASMLAEQKFDLSGVYMRNWDTRDEEGRLGCEWEQDWEDVRRICKSIGIPCELIDLSREYWLDVFEPAMASWNEGATPNPDVDCNRHIKFGALAKRFLCRDPTSWLATGHYVRLLPTTSSLRGSSTSDSHSLHRAIHLPKDQSYFLSTSSPSILSRSIFPLGTLTKDRVREIAKERGFFNSDKKESMGICFVGERKRFNRFLDEYLPQAPPGPIIHLPTGRVMGQHGGLWRYTIGQRIGLAGLGEKLFVANKDMKKNEILAVPQDHPALYSIAIETNDFHWLVDHHIISEILKEQNQHPALNGQGRPSPFIAQTRSRVTSASPCLVEAPNSQPSPSSLSIRFNAPVMALSAGQTVALYHETMCLGGGTIAKTITADRKII